LVRHLILISANCTEHRAERARTVDRLDWKAAGLLSTRTPPTTAPEMPRLCVSTSPRFFFGFKGGHDVGGVYPLASPGLQVYLEIEGDPRH